MIYFDNGATTFPKPEAVQKAVNDLIKGYSANPGRSGHTLSMKAAEAVYKCRENLKIFLNVPDIENIIFTQNCTAALNTVIKGILRENDHVVISCLEHNSVVRPIEALRRIGVTYSIANVYVNDNNKTLNSFRESINPQTRLVVCTHASNVFGIMLPVARISALCHQYDIPLCLDAAQTAGVVPIDVVNMGIDYLCAPGHKGLYGPMGTGIIIINNTVIPDSLMEGGTGSVSNLRQQPDIMPDKLESGTLNVPGIVGLNAGIDFIKKKGIDNIFSHEMKLIQHLYDSLAKMHKVNLFTEKPDRENFVPLLSFSVTGYNSEDIAHMLNQKYKIAVRAGLHCAPLAHEYMNTIDEGTVRVCPSIFNNIYQINILSQAIKEVASG